MAFTLLITALSPAASEKKIQSIKAVRAIYRVVNQTPLGLREAKTLVDDADSGIQGTVLTAIDARTAEAAAAFLAVYGVQTRVDEPLITVRQSAVTEAVRLLELYGCYKQADGLSEAVSLSGRTVR